MRTLDHVRNLATLISYKISHVCNTLSSVGQIDDHLCKHVLAANSESSGQFLEDNSGFKRKGRLDSADASYQTNEPCIYKLDSIIQNFCILIG